VRPRAPVQSTTGPRDTHRGLLGSEPELVKLREGSGPSWPLMASEKIKSMHVSNQSTVREQSQSTKHHCNINKTQHAKEVANATFVTTRCAQFVLCDHQLHHSHQTHVFSALLFESSTNCWSSDNPTKPKISRRLLLKTTATKQQGEKRASRPMAHPRASHETCISTMRSRRAPKILCFGEGLV
jgi:hypothetical protein